MLVTKLKVKNRTKECWFLFAFSKFIQKWYFMDGCFRVRRRKLLTYIFELFMQSIKCTYLHITLLLHISTKNNNDPSNNIPVNWCLCSCFSFTSFFRSCFATTTTANTIHSATTSPSVFLGPASFYLVEYKYTHMYA